MKARVFVSPKTTVLDPQGQAIRSALHSLGYAAIADVRQGKLFEIAIADGVTREQALQGAQQAHRNYAKRQMTWFRREPDVQWLRGFGDDAQIQREAAVQVSGLGS